jgi:hypothetical protein
MKKTLSAFMVLVLLALPALGLMEIDQTASNQLHAAQKMVRETKNITVSGTHSFTYEVGGVTTPITYTDTTVTFHDPLIIHNTVPLGTGDGELYHLFMVQQGDEMLVFASQGTEDYQSYAEEIHQDDLVPETMGELDSLTHGIDAMLTAQMDGEETVTVNGVDRVCVRILMTTHVLDYVEELVHNTLLANPAFDQKWSDEIEVTLAKLTMPFTYWIDKETGMLVQYTYDLTEVYNGIFAYIPDETDGGLRYTSYVHTYQVTGVNDAEDILIPAEYIAFNEH